ncbi:hypothetical protein ACFP2T_38505 [Plantactinospora solaniradicis]|uniref:Uncharacterized protein n=1 Tax=Plantactinospora solaniradicis TaxID=1723736 RepID=A0ABW1KM32_9ACTN
MRRTFVRSVVAALVAVVATLPGGARPAQASTGSLLSPITQIYGTLAGGGQPEQVVRQVVTAVAGIRADVLAQLERVSISGVRTCATRHVVEFADLERLAPAAVRTWARDATACVALIDAHLQAAQVGPPQPTPVGPADAKHTVDLLGLVVNVVGPIAMTARLHAGLGNDGLRQVLVGANTTVVSKIEPWCSEGPVYEDDSNVYELWFVCYAFNYSTLPTIGRAEAFQLFLLPPGCEPWHSCEAAPLGPPVDKDRVRSETMKHTSWVVARAVLPLL